VKLVKEQGRTLTKPSQRILVAAAIAIAPLSARATGIMVARFGGEHGTPMTDDPTALYYNPAGIAWAVGTHLYVEGLFAYRSYSFDRNPLGIDHPNATPGTPDATAISANSGKASLSNIVSSPFLGVTSDLGVNNLGVGAAVYVPFGGNAQWSKNDAFTSSTQYPGAQDGAQRWWDIEGEIRSIYFTVGGAYRLPSANLSLGVGANIVLHNTKDLRASNADGTDNLVNADGSIAEGRALIDTSGVTFALGVGLAWRPTPAWTLGFSYQSQPGFGTMSEEGTLEKKLGQTAITNQDIDHQYALPDVFRLGASFRPSPAMELRLWGSLERWSLFKQECLLDKSDPKRNCALTDRGAVAPGGSGIINVIPRYWQDGFAVRASGSYWIKPSIELMLGVGYDSNAVPDQTLELSLPDEAKVNVTAGAIFKDVGIERLSLNLEYTAFIAFSRTIDPRPRMNGEPVTPYDPPTRVPDSAGSYSEFIGVLTVGVGYAF
jgi:long-chain fatty acid transport protein